MYIPFGFQWVSHVLDFSVYYFESIFVVAAGIVESKNAPGVVTRAAHCSRGQSRGAKKMPMKFEGAMKISASRALKRAPTWHSCMTTPKSLSGQPLDQVWIRLARKGFWGSHTAMSCGGSFRSSWCADFHAALGFHWYFLCPQAILPWRYMLMTTPKSLFGQPNPDLIDPD